jgi:hypothetical protein
MLVHLVVLLLTCGTQFGRDAGFDARPPADVASQVLYITILGSFMPALAKLAKNGSGRDLQR